MENISEDLITKEKSEIEKMSKEEEIEYYNNIINKCKCDFDECLLCPKEALNVGLCTKCNT